MTKFLPADRRAALPARAAADGAHARHTPGNPGLTGVRTTMAA